MLRKYILFSLFFSIYSCAVIFSQNRDAVKFFNSGKEAESTGNYTEALFYYSLAADLDNTYVEAFTSRGNIYKRMKNYGKAKSDFDRVIKLNPSYEAVLMDLGELDI